MSRQETTIPMPDGTARAFVCTPDQGDGPWPTVLMYMDALAIRPAMFELAEHLAGHGYYVLLPDLYWRLGPYSPPVVKALLADRALLNDMRSSTDNERAMQDTGVFLDWLAKQPQAKADKVGTIGYCMGANMALRAAGVFPERVAAVGAFHGSNMATDAPDSPHLLASKMKAKVLVAGADQDRGFDDDEKIRLDEALRAAGVDAEVTIYRGALHGYAPRDMPVYDPEACARHWRDAFALFDKTLG